MIPMYYPEEVNPQIQKEDEWCQGLEEWRAGFEIGSSH